MLIIVAYVLLGIIAGIVSGLVGLGGGAVIIPALIFIFGFSQKEAQGTTLALMIPPIGLLAVLEYYRNGYVNLKAAIIIASFFFLGAFLGAKIACNMNPTLLRKIFAVFLMLVAIWTFFKK